jgi:lysophospholipase L1-like esterase
MGVNDRRLFACPALIPHDLEKIFFAGIFLSSIPPRLHSIPRENSARARSGRLCALGTATARPVAATRGSGVGLVAQRPSARGLFRNDVIAMGTYLALGDSISIDDYTGVHGGGAPSQLARKLGLDLVDLTRDGNMADGVLADLARAPAAADIVTVTAGGNDLLSGHLPHAIVHRLHQIAERIQPLGARVVINTIYDPSDGNNDVGRRELGLSRLAAIALRRRLNAVNRGIRKLARDRGFLLADLERLFHGHGVASDESWFVQVIEPNLAGATAIAEHWYQLLASR